MINKKTRWGAPVVLTAVLLWILFQFVSVREVTASVLSLSWQYWVLGFVLYVISTLLRAIRFHVFLPKEEIYSLFNITYLHNFFNNILPLRLGEFSLPYYLKRYKRVAVPKVLGMLLGVRLLDVVVIGILFFVSVFFVPVLAQEVILLFGLFSGISIVVLGMLLLYPQTCLRLADKLLNGFRNQLQQKGKNALQKMVQTIGGIKQQEPRLLFLSILIWLSKYGMYFVIFRGLGLELSFMAIVLGGTLYALTAILPIQGVGNFGTMEGAWSLAFILFMVPAEQAIAAGFTIHIVEIVYFSLLGLYGHIQLNR